MRLRFWLDNSRKIALPQSALPCLTAIVLCIGQEGFVWWLALPVLLGVSLFTGALTGLIAACLFRALAHTNLMRE